jgi:hypothetical protein
MVRAKRARKAETPKQPSLSLRLRTPYFYPTTVADVNNRGEAYTEYFVGQKGDAPP